MSETIILNQVPPSLVVEVYSLMPIGPRGFKGDKGDKGDQGVSGEVPEAPMDGDTYGRQGGRWFEVLPIQGGAMTGPLGLNRITDGYEVPIDATVRDIPRWKMVMGNNSPETGENAGSDFAISRFSDIGDPLGTAIHVTRQSGAIDLSAIPTIKGVPLLPIGDDAPVDTFAYGRQDGGWAQVLPLTGGEIRGTLSIFGQVTVDPGVVTSGIATNSKRGRFLIVKASNAGDELSSGGNLELHAGNGGATRGYGGSAYVESGDTRGIPGGTAGSLNLLAGRGYDGSKGGYLQVRAGSSDNDTGGAVTIHGGTNNGTAADMSGFGGNVTLAGGAGSSGGGTVYIAGGAVPAGSAMKAGDVIIDLVTPADPGLASRLLLKQIPKERTDDPNGVWNNRGVLNIGAGGTMIDAPLVFAGSYDVQLDVVDLIGAGDPGPLPAPEKYLDGKFIICTNDGPGLGEAAAYGPYHAEDWLVCGEVPSAIGTFAWHKVTIGYVDSTAENVGVTPILGLGATTVQEALEELEQTKLEYIDTTVFVGDGLTAATPLSIAIIDGGTF
jgi:hypothetical protein